MKMKKIALILALFPACEALYAQETVSMNGTEETQNAKVEGTYQIIIKDSEKEIILPASVLPEIEKRRDATQVVDYQYAENVVIRILPESIINSPSFNPAEYPVYVFENKKPQPKAVHAREKNKFNK